MAFDMRGYYTPSGEYKGWVQNKYKIFASEWDYEQYMKKSQPKTVMSQTLRYFLDVHGIIGDRNDILNEGDIVEYWNDNHTTDPEMKACGDFTIWWRAIKTKFEAL